MNVNLEKSGFSSDCLFKYNLTFPPIKLLETLNCSNTKYPYIGLVVYKVVYLTMSAQNTEQCNEDDFSFSATYC